MKVNTANILFICGGAFDGIDRKISQRLNMRVVGFNQSVGVQIDRKNLMQYVTPQDLRSFGLIPELVGRLPVLTHLQPLDAAALRQILTEPKNAIIKQYERLFALDGVKLVFEDKVFDYIVKKAMQYKLGARGLRSICEAIMTDAMFEVPSQQRKTLRITLAYAQRKIEASEVLRTA